MNETFFDPTIKRLEECGTPTDLIKEVQQRFVDRLTGLPRGEAGREYIDGLIKDKKHVVVEFDDLRFLKTFNTRIGHPKTDELIATIGSLYRAKVRELREKGVEIEIARYGGGDEFLIVIGNKTKKDARPILNEIHRSLKQIKKPRNAFFKPHFSRGLVASSELPEGRRNTATLLEWADRRVEKDKLRKFKYIKERAKKGKNEPTRKLLAKIQRYA